MTRARRWAVIGGGLLGLTIARRLRAAGSAVTLFEAAPQLGGLASAWRLGDVTWDRHYHVTLLSDFHTRAMLRDLGLEAQMRWTTTGTGFFAGDGVRPLSNAFDYLRLPHLNLWEKARLAATILYAARVRDWRRLEEIPVADWLTRLSGRSTFERLWLPLLRAKLGESWRETSAAFIWATIQRLWAARTSGIKREMLGYVPGGYAAIVARHRELLENAGVAVRVATAVKTIEAAGAGVRVACAEAAAETFDSVVLTTTPRVAAQLCTGLAEPERAVLERVRHQGIVCASLLYPEPLSNYYLTYLTDASLPFTAVVEMSAFVDRAEFGGRSLIYLPRYASAREPVFAQSDAEIESSFLAALARVHPRFDRSRVLAFRVSRVREVFPIPTLGYSRHVPAASLGVPGVHLVSSAQIVNGTLNVNETVALAERAASALVASGGAPISLEA